jgi:hypothetical protein
VSAQELTYPQKSCCSAIGAAAAARPSGFALMVAKSLILFMAQGCRENGQGSQKPGKSRAWVHLPQLAHKVIHKKCGQRQKRFSIINLGGFFHIDPSFRMQLERESR